MKRNERRKERVCRRRKRGEGGEGGGGTSAIGCDSSFRRDGSGLSKDKTSSSNGKLTEVNKMPVIEKSIFWGVLTPFGSMRGGEREGTRLREEQLWRRGGGWGGEGRDSKEKRERIEMRKRDKQKSKKKREITNMGETTIRFFKTNPLSFRGEKSGAFSTSSALGFKRAPVEGEAIRCERGVGREKG